MLHTEAPSIDANTRYMEKNQHIEVIKIQSSSMWQHEGNVTKVDVPTMTF